MQFLAGILILGVLWYLFELAIQYIDFLAIFAGAIAAVALLLIWRRTGWSTLYRRVAAGFLGIVAVGGIGYGLAINSNLSEARIAERKEAQRASVERADRERKTQPYLRDRERCLWLSTYGDKVEYLALQGFNRCMSDKGWSSADHDRFRDAAIASDSAEAYRSKSK